MTNHKPSQEQMDISIRTASLTLIVLLLALAIVTGYWQLVQGASLAARKDNPRLVLAERQIPRGAILDRDGHPLAFSQRAAEEYARYYPEPAAAPVVGYYSLRYGLGGAEEAFDRELRGSADQTRWEAFVNRLLHRVPPGRPVRLTLDASVQRAADTAFGNQAGAAVVLSVPEGEVIALVSHPTFDPARLDQDWEKLRADASSPLLNRATQGVYQPGAAFQTVMLSEALSRGLIHLTSTVPVSGPVRLGNTPLACATSPLTATLAAAFAAGCPAPFDELVGSFDVGTMTQVVQRWQLDAALPSFELPAHESGFSPAALATTQSLRELILGQGALTVSPLQMAFMMGTIANGGRPIAPPHLTFNSTSASSPSFVVPPKVANAIQSALATRDDLGGQIALAVSGENRLTWFLGFAPALSPRWVIVVLLENGEVENCYQIAASIQAKLAP